MFGKSLIGAGSERLVGCRIGFNFLNPVRLDKFLCLLSVHLKKKKEHKGAYTGSSQLLNSAAVMEDQFTSEPFPRWMNAFLVC